MLHLRGHMLHLLFMVTIIAFLCVFFNEKFMLFLIYVIKVFTKKYYLLYNLNTGGIFIWQKKEIILVLVTLLVLF